MHDPETETLDAAFRIQMGEERSDKVRNDTDPEVEEGANRTKKSQLRCWSACLGSF